MLRGIKQFKAMDPGDRVQEINHASNTDPAFGIAIAALDADRLRRVGELVDTGLNGIPYLAKDLYDVPGFPTTASSTFLTSIRTKSAESSALDSELAAAGACCVGKTHLNEFAYGLSGENAHYGDCPHPMIPHALSGGSSSGSAYSVAKGWVPLATGTDTGGSIRVPAAFCGVWGVRYKPGFLMEGCFPLAPSFDTVGFFTRSLEDLQLVHGLVCPDDLHDNPLELTAAFHPGWISDPVLEKHYRQELDIRGIPIDEALTETMDRWMRKLPEAYSVLQSLEALDVHKDWLDAYKDQYDPATYGRIERARHWTDEQIKSAEHVRDAFNKWVDGVLQSDRCLVMPAVPCPSPPKPLLNDAFRNRLLALMTPGSMAGLPSFVEPFFMGDSDLSMGFQYLHADMRALSSNLLRLKR